MWIQDDIYLAENRLVRPVQFGIKVIKKIKYHNMIEEKQRRALEKEVRKKGINTSDAK